MKLQFLKNSIYLYFAKGVNIAFPLVIIPLLVKTLTIEGFGILVLVQVIMGYGGTLVDYGFDMIGVRDIGTASSPKRIGEILGEALVVKFFLVVISLLLIVFSGFFIPILIDKWGLLIVGWLAVLGNAFYPIWYFQGIEKMYIISIINIFSKIIVFGLLIYFIIDISQVQLALLFLSLGPIINALLSWIQIIFICKERLVYPNKKRVLQVFDEGKDIFLSNTIVQIYSNFVVVISSNVLSFTEIGILGIFIKLRDVANSAIGPIQIAIFPELSRLAKKFNYILVQNLIKKTLLVLITIMILMSFGLIVFYESINDVLFTNHAKFEEFLIFIIILLALPFGGIFTKTLVVYGKMKWIRITTLFSGILTIIIAYPFMFMYGLNGALWVLSLSYSLNAIIGWFYARKMFILS